MTTDNSSTTGKPDLDVWRAEAATCAPLDAAATKGPWRSTWGDDEAADAERGKQGEEVVLESTVLEGHERLVLGTLWHDGLRPCCREEDAAFIAAARTGWPRDAARVGVLCERVAALEAHVATLDALKAIGDRQEALADRFAARCEVLGAALLDAAAFIEPPPNAYLSPSVLFAARDKAAELRAIAAGTSATTGEEPAR